MPSMPKPVARLAAILVLAALTPAFAAAPAPSAKSSPDALFPAVQESVEQLSSPAFHTREQAGAALQEVLGRQLHALVSSPDPAARDRVVEILEFNQQLNRWLLDTLKFLSNDERKAELDFGSRPDILPFIVQLYSPETGKRVSAVRNLAKSDAPEVVPILARFTDDSDRAVAGAAMQALTKRPPTDIIINALWNRAVGSGFPNGHAFPMPVANPGRLIMRTQYADPQDVDAACDLLISLKSPLVTARVKAVFESFEDAYKQGGNNIPVYSDSRGPMKSIGRILLACPSNDLLPPLYRLATAPSTRSAMMNGQNFWSNRTQFIAFFIEATNQKPEDFQLRRIKNLGDAWTFPNQNQEEETIEKLKQWWEKNASSYTTPAATKPAGG